MFCNNHLARLSTKETPLAYSIGKGPPGGAPTHRCSLYLLYCSVCSIGKGPRGEPQRTGAHLTCFAAHFTCFTSLSTKETPLAYAIEKGGGARGEPLPTGAHFTCYTGTKVQILTFSTDRPPALPLTSVTCFKRKKKTKYSQSFFLHRRDPRSCRL